MDLFIIEAQKTEEINSNASVVAGPFHSSYRELVESSIYFDIISKQIKEGKGVVYVNPSEISKAIGNKKENIKKLKEQYNADIIIKGDDNLKKREVKYECC